MFGEQAVQSGHADVVQPVDPIAHGFGAHRRLLCRSLVGGTRGEDKNRALAGGRGVGPPGDCPRDRMKARVWNPFSDRSVSVGVGARDQQRMAGRDDALGYGGDLRGGLPWAENHLWKALANAPLMVHPSESEVFEGGLAQIL